MTTSVFFEHLLLPSGWGKNICLSMAAGVITAIAAAGAPPPGAARHAIGLPGLPNLHSHTFQRAMAGLAEYRGPGTDNFWSWRAQMYRFGLNMNPEDVEAVAAQAFAEMLESGFTAVAEFHYLHHAPDGKPYADIAEMAARIAAAATTTGIDLRLLPVFYAHANFGGLPPSPGQRRFICTLDEFSRLHERCRALGQVGIAPHSLRAVTPAQLTALAVLAAGAPLHIHIAEQRQEVADCMAWSGLPPVAWLLAHAAVDASWCLIHATHADAAERAGIVQSGAVLGLCPITEANLGDGILPHCAAPFGIGTDSNVLIDAHQELRQLEYAQRLLLQERNVLTSPAQPGNATSLYLQAVAGGAQALGQPAGIRLGAAANFVTLDTARLGPAGAITPETALNLAVFASRHPAIDEVWVRGRQLVANGRHLKAAALRKRFDTALKSLL